MAAPSGQRSGPIDEAKTLPQEDVCVMKRGSTGSIELASVPYCLKGAKQAVKLSLHRPCIDGLPRDGYPKSRKVASPSILPIDLCVTKWAEPGNERRSSGQLTAAGGHAGTCG